MEYIILDTETTRDFCESLIGTRGTFLRRKNMLVESGLTAPHWQEYVYLDTLDGELIFLADEVIMAV